MLLFLSMVLAGLMVVAGASTAGAATMTATVSDGTGDNGASFDETPTDLTGLRVTWDGQLTVALTYAAAPRSPALTMIIADGTAVDEESSCDDQSADSLAITVDRAGRATLEMPYVNGRLDGTATATSATATTYVFASEVLAEEINRSRDPFVCVSGDADGDGFLGHFDGRLLRLTRESAEAAVAGELTHRYGTAFKANAAHTWIKCPSQLIQPQTSKMAPTAECQFEFRAPSGIYHGGWTSAVLVGGQVDAGSNMKLRSYRKTMASCHIASRRGGWTNGLYLTGRQLRYTGSLGTTKDCNWLVGGAGMANDIESEIYFRLPKPVRRYHAHQHGTGTGYFAEEASFPCRVGRSGSRYRFDCRNQLGDRFIYSFTVHRR